MPTVATEIAKRVIRPILLEGNRPAVGLYAGEHCKFHLPIDLVMGKDADKEGAFQLMVTNLRQIIEQAINMADTDGDKLTGARIAALRFATQHVEGLVKSLKTDGMGSPLGLMLCFNGEDKFWIPMLHTDFPEQEPANENVDKAAEELKTILATAMIKAMMDFYHWHVTNEVRDYMDTVQRSE